jgi:hypothetical protein
LTPRVTHRSVAAFGVAVVLALSADTGCGSDGSDGSAGSGSAKSIRGPAPQALLGTYNVTLKPSDLPPNPPLELTDGPPSWELTIANSGGPSGGRSFAIANTALGVLEESDFGVQRNRIVLHREECASAQGYRFHENEYRWKLSGNTLRFTTASNSCPDRVAETILTSRPWSRAG